VGLGEASPERYCAREVGLLLLVDHEHSAEEIVEALVSSARPISEVPGETKLATQQGYRVLDLEAAYAELGLSRELESRTPRASKHHGPEKVEGARVARAGRARRYVFDVLRAVDALKTLQQFSPTANPLVARG